MKRFLRAVLSAVAILACPGVGAAADDLIAIKTGKLIDVIGERVRTDQIILVEGDRISKVGSARSVAIPAAAHVIDLSATRCCRALSTRIRT